MARPDKKYDEGDDFTDNGLDDHLSDASNDEIEQGEDPAEFLESSTPARRKKSKSEPPKKGSNTKIMLAVGGALLAFGGFAYISSIGKSSAPMPEVQALPGETAPIKQAEAIDPNVQFAADGSAPVEAYDPNGIAEAEPVLDPAEMAKAQAAEAAANSGVAQEQAPVAAAPMQPVAQPMQTQPAQAAATVNQVAPAAQVNAKAGDTQKVVYAESISPNYPKAPPRPVEQAAPVPAAQVNNQAMLNPAAISFPETEVIKATGTATQQKVAVLEARIAQFERVLNAMGYQFTKFEVGSPKKEYVAPVKKPVVKKVEVKKAAVAKTTKVESEVNLGQIDPTTGAPYGAVEKDNFIKIKEQEARAAEAQMSMKPAAMSLYAVIPGRAWIRDGNGNRYTVTVGESLPGYGQVTAINPESGQVLTSGGAIH